MRSCRSFALPAAAVLLACSAPALAHPTCTVVDTLGSFMALSAKTANLSDEQQLLLAFRKDYLARHRELYGPDAIPLPADTAQRDALVLKHMRRAREHPEWRTFDARFVRSFQQAVKRFSAVFPDFRCDFPVYIAESFGAMSGAGRVIGGRPSLVLDFDASLRMSRPLEALPVFFSHELFHRYHFQAAGFSDDLAERDLIWRSLWAEGLATYVSAQLNRSLPLSDALGSPNLEARAKPLVPQMAAELLAAADKVDAQIFAKFFELGETDAARVGWPQRSGYYIGYLVAQDLGRRHSLKELAHMKGPPLRAALGAALARLTHG